VSASKSVSTAEDVSESEDDDDEDFRTTIIGNTGDFSNLPRGVDKVVGNIFGQKKRPVQRPPYRPHRPPYRPLYVPYRGQVNLAGYPSGRR